MPPTPRTTSWLDRPVDALVPRTAEGLAWTGLVLVTLVSRFLDLGARAMSHDESIHAYLAFSLFERGSYRHDPAYHGPLLFHANALVYWLFGASDTTARIVPAVAGVGVVLSLSLFRSYVGRTGAWLAAFLAAVSPTLLFYSRYLLSDIYIALFSLLWIYGAFRYLDDRRQRWLVLVTVAMALSFLAKEVTFIFGPIVGVFFAALFLVRLFRGRERWGDSGAGDVAALMLSLALPFAAPLGLRALGWATDDYASAAGLRHAALVVAALFAVSTLGAWAWFRNGRDAPAQRAGLSLSGWGALMALFWGLQALFFTTFLTNVPAGLVSGVVGSLGYWLGQHAVARGSHPWSYYPVLVGLYEFLPFALAVGATATVLRRLRARGWAPVPDRDLPRAAGADEAQARRPAHTGGRRTGAEFLRFCVWWAAASWVAYTAAGEKMPWLLVHLVLPLCVLGGWWLARVLEAIDWPVTGMGTSLLVGGGTAVVTCLVVGLLLTEPVFGRELRAVATTVRWLLGVLTVLALLVLLVRHTRKIGPAAGRRLATVGLVALGALLTVRVAARLAYVNYDLATEPIVYAHGTPDIKQALAEIQLVSERTVGGKDLKIAYDDDSTWPLVWYLREYRNARYYGVEPTPDAMTAPVIIVGPKSAAKVRPFVERGYVRRSYRLIWWPPQGFASLSWTQVTRLLVDRAARQELWHLVHHRHYPRVTLDEWPNDHRFTLYIRRDLARDVWPLAPEAALARESGPVSPPIRELRRAPLAIHAGPYAGKRLRSPTALALAPDGALVIADGGNDRIVVLNRDGTFRLAFGGTCVLRQGSGGGCVDPDGAEALELGDGQFREPWGLAVSPRGDIYVADTWNGRIQAFDARGRFLRKWGRFGQNRSVDSAVEPLVLYGPRGLALDAGGDLLVVDTGNERLLRFGPKGEPKEQMGGAGAAPGRFLEPVGLAIDPRGGSVYVADTWNRRIQRLDERLRPVAEWAVPSWASRSALSKPYLAVDGAGSVYASDPDHSRILIHTAETRAEVALALEGDAPPRPLGVAVATSSRRLFIADQANDRVLVFSAYEKPSP